MCGRYVSGVVLQLTRDNFSVIVVFWGVKVSIPRKLTLISISTLFVSILYVYILYALYNMWCSCMLKVGSSLHSYYSQDHLSVLERTNMPCIKQPLFLYLQGSSSILYNVLEIRLLFLYDLKKSYKRTQSNTCLNMWSLCPYN